MFLPMIDLNPTDVTCITSTLNFVTEHAKEHGVANPIIIFDQPMWLKAFDIIQSEPVDSDLPKVIVRLGAFHAMVQMAVISILDQSQKQTRVGHGFGL